MNKCKYIHSLLTELRVFFYDLNNSGGQHDNKQGVLMDIMIGPGNFFQFFCVFCETKNAKLDPAASVASNMANFGCHHREVH